MGPSVRSCPLAPRPGDRSPAQERVFQIFSSRMTMAARWDRSPVSRKMFIAAAVGAARRPRSSAAAATQDAATAPERGSGGRWRERARRGQGRGRTAVARAGQPGRAGDRRGHAPPPRPLKAPRPGAAGPYLPRGLPTEDPECSAISVSRVSARVPAISFFKF